MTILEDTQYGFSKQEVIKHELKGLQQQLIEQSKELSSLMNLVKKGGDV